MREQFEGTLQAVLQCKSKIFRVTTKTSTKTVLCLRIAIYCPAYIVFFFPVKCEMSKS